MRQCSLFALCAALAACGSGGHAADQTSDPNAAASPAETLLAAELAQSGVSCAPRPPHAGPCKDKHAGDACFFAAAGTTVIGFCTDVPARSALACIPPPPAEFVQACAHAHPTDACSVELSKGTFTGACRMGPDGKTLVCAPVCRH
jgi:hypothetical protein